MYPNGFEDDEVAEPAQQQQQQPVTGAQGDDLEEPLP